MKPIQPVEDQDKLCCLAALTDCPNVTQVAQDTVQHQTHTHTAARLNFDNAGVDERHAPKSGTRYFSHPRLRDRCPVTLLKNTDGWSAFFTLFLQQ